MRNGRRGRRVKGFVNQQAAQKIRKRAKTWKLMKKNWLLYMFLLPAALYIAIFHYGPMYGLQIAFRDYKAVNGIWGSKWVGLKWITTFMNTPRFWMIFKNTLKISLYSLISFPFPIILAVFLNNVRNVRRKKFVQTVTYMPHFISTVVLVGMLSLFLSPRNGIVNMLVGLFGGPTDTYFMGQADYFSHIYVWSGIWQSMGWGSIIYVAALTGVDQELHDAAQVDGANKLQRIWHIDIPSILPTIIIMLILRLGSIMGVGYEKVYLMQNSLNLTSSEVISTYVYKMGLQDQRFSYSAAIGLFNNVINFIVLIIANKTADKVSGSSLW